MKKLLPVLSLMLVTPLFALRGAGAATISATGQTEGQSSSAQDDQLIGVWEGNGPSDSGGQQHTVLELRPDHTYTKTHQAKVNGTSYGGTHSGTWTANGMKVRLSGDGNFPPYTQDLSVMRKVR
jgi:hypothetical protein